MRKLLTAILAMAVALEINAQALSPDVQKAFDACLALAKASGSANTAGLISANNAFKLCNTAEYRTLKVLTKDIPSADGHFVWDEDFVDALIKNRQVREFAQRYVSARCKRSTTTKVAAYTKTLTAHALSSTSFLLAASGRQNLCVIAEPGGAVTMKIHDITNDVYYNDTDNVNDGEAFRKRVFDLPNDVRCELEVKIVNCTDKEISFVIIGD